MLHLFCSFRSLLLELKHGTRAKEHLAAGLFYLDCSRLHAFAPWKHDGIGANKGQFNELHYLFLKRANRKDQPADVDGDLAGRVHLQLVAALEEAERDGRIAWRPEDGHRDYHTLNGLLAANGQQLALIPRDHTAFIIGSGRCFREALKGRDIIVCD